MITTVVVTESTDALLDLTVPEAAALRAAGSRLASTKSWWGAAPIDPLADRTVIRVTPAGSGVYRVRVIDAIGVVSVGGIQLLVQPKIPSDHLLHLLAHSGRVPRPDLGKAELLPSASLWEVVAAWFMGEMERLFRRDLVRDYIEVADDLETARGQLDVVGTTRLFLAGRPHVAAVFDEFGYDTPLNRVLRAATQLVASGPTLDSDLRRRAARLLGRMEDIGPLRPGDEGAAPDRRAAHYRAALALALAVIHSVGRDMGAGNEIAWTFLIRTPEMVEAALFNILADAVGNGRIIKKGKPAKTSPMTFTPDLVVDGGTAVADVKYKIRGPEWYRPDLYQILAFSEAFEVSRGAVIAFASVQSPPATALGVGQCIIQQIDWPADPSISASDAADVFIARARTWLDAGNAPSQPSGQS